MDKLVIHGGRRLQGEVSISGAKNAALPLLAAAILAPGKHVFHNVPRLRDIDTTLELLTTLGVEVDRSGLQHDHTLAVDTANLKSHLAPYELVKTMRASVLVLGPLLARTGKAEVSLPGGCAIGARPVNLHLKGMEQLGAEVQIEHGYIKAQADKLHGAEIAFDISTVTGTENVMMAAVKAEGRTVLTNAALEPEVVELAEVLVKMGAKIKGQGTEVIEIEGVKELRPVEHAIMPDRIEAGTFLAAAAITGGELLLKGARADHLAAVIAKLREAGVAIEEKGGGLRVRGDGLRAVDVSTRPYPGFPTDMQAQLIALMCRAEGLSVITETVFENRFMHVLELQRMGANIKIQGRSAIVTGVPKLSGASVMATDLRASASLVLAGLIAEGTTEVLRIYHLDRGYETLENKLQAVGADIERAKESKP